MTPQERERNSANLRARMAGLRETHAGSPRSFVIGRFVNVVRDLDVDLQDAAFWEAGLRFYSEQSRGRVSGLRRDYAVQRDGQTLSLSLLEQTFTEAKQTVAGELSHALGAQSRADYDAFTLELARARCVERGLDPDATELVIGTFVSADEIAWEWDRRAAA